MIFSQSNRLLSVPSGSLTIETADQPNDGIRHPPLELSLVLPTYNEAQNLEFLVSQLCSLLDQVMPAAYELIVVDDNSPDHTWKLALELIHTYPQLQVMRRLEERGLSTAIIRGWQRSGGRVLGVIDADLQHPPKLLLRLWSEIQRGADLAVASRHLEDGGVSDWSITRRFLSRGAQILGLIWLPGVVGRVSDPMSGYFLVRRSCLEGCPLNPIGYKILIEILGRSRVNWIGEIGYVFQERYEGSSKVTYQHYVDYLRHLLRLRLDLWPIERFVRFGVVGFSGVFVDLAIFYLLHGQWGLALTRSAILSAEVAIINNFLWNDLWTFRDISQTQPGMSRRLKRFLKFNLICVAGLILNVLTVNVLFNLLHINEYIAKLIAIAAVTLWNFWINLKLSWRVTEVD